MRKIVAWIRFFPILLFYPVYSKNRKLQMDANVWAKRMHMEGSFLKKICMLFMFGEKAFRNLFIYRVCKHHVLTVVVKLFYPIEKTLYIESMEIGGGLYIQHGFATQISAKKIGEYCWINQQVTIGYNGKGCPVLGDRVFVTCGAKVLGDIEIGDNTMIAANAAVVKSFPEGNGVLAGVPAKMIKKYTV